MRVGISVLTQAGLSIWSNGLGQNVFHLARLFRTLPFVDEVILLNSGDQEALTAESAPGYQDFPLIRPRDATDRVDVVVELSGGLDVEWLDYIRALGKKVVYHVCGTPYTGLVEGPIFGKDAYFSRGDRCDEVWNLPRDNVFQPLLGALHRCPVFDVPFIWSPEFLEQRRAVLAQHNLEFGFARAAPGAGPRPMRAAIFEPNISVTKMASIPMLVCDQGYRRNSEAINKLNVLNSVQMVNHLTFNMLANSMDIVRAGKALFLGRHDFAAFMAEHGDMVITHQWQHDMNYLYLDALYGNYPLIHNSPWLGSVGYYYPDSDIEVGGEQVLNAWANHDQNFETYKRDARAFLDALSPVAPANLDYYARRLLYLQASPSRRKSA